MNVIMAEMNVIMVERNVRMVERAYKVQLTLSVKQVGCLGAEPRACIRQPYACYIPARYSTNATPQSAWSDPRGPC
jgi:hypothetical protein